MMHNNLVLNRLVIYTKKGDIAYDEKFHLGVNIIRGNNSSGKSTISHFIFYILGGSFNDWVKEARECSVVYGEVTLNGAVVTLKRKLIFNEEGTGNKQQAIEFYWGSFDDANNNTDGEWQRFPFNKSDNKKSFSNVLFENLGIPIVKGDNNITMHQLLRLMYIDQESPISSLFLYEYFDTVLTRETVSDLLLGVYDQNLYDDQQQLENFKKEHEDLKGEISVIKKFIPNKEDLFPDHINTRISKKESEILELDKKILDYKGNSKRLNYTEKSKLEFEVLNQNSIQQREFVKKLSNEVNSLELDIEDTNYFLKALKSKLTSIRNSIVTREFLGSFSIDKCPECLTPITKPETDNVCGLCKNERDNSVGVTEARKIEQEISFQIQESKRINVKKEKELTEKRVKLDVEKKKLFQLQVRVNQALSDVRSYREEKVDKLYEDRGFIEGELIQLRTLLENAELYQNKQLRLNDLSMKINGLETRISRLKREQEKSKGKINDKIESIGVYLLNNDVKRQQEFFQANEFHVDYRNNMTFISEKNAKYSASSSFYLRNSARFAIFLASLSMDKMRYPRFILCDNMEDKGIEAIRVHNFQKILIEYLKKFKHETYQVIYTTSFILPELDNEKYCVGDFYTQSNPSLKNV
ncbi:hypothetical protein HZP20_16955 [Elizabethkingia anophelis]|nr:hypothetical protein [Elizabethkingia anophelis]